MGAYKNAEVKLASESQFEQGAVGAGNTEGSLQFFICCC